MAIHSKSSRPDTPTWRVAGVVGLSTLLLALAWLLAALAWHDVPDLLRHVPGPDELIVGIAEVAGALVACWLSFGVLITALAVLAGVRPALPILPSSLRRLVVGLQGASTAMGVTLPAQAAPAVVVPAAATIANGDPLDPGWVPTTGPLGPGPSATPAPHTTPAPHPSQTPRPAAPQHVAPRPTTPARAAKVVTVHRGDTLWDIARRQLAADGHRPVPGQIARAWPRWFHANEGVIGHDPDHLTPGMHLHRPTTD